LQQRRQLSNVSLATVTRRCHHQPSSKQNNSKAIAGVLHQWKAKIFVITNDADLTHALKQIAR
jgi:rRNA-processing protein FCF1